MALPKLTSILVPFALCFHISDAVSKFLIVSAPRHGRIAYTKISRRGTRSQASMRTLIETGLVHPQGLAVDQRRGQLLVTDPDSRRIFSYRLHVHGDELTVDQPTVLAEGTEARWVAVDGVGNVFFTDEPSNQVNRISAENIRQGISRPEVVYDGNSLTQVSSPGGIAIDSFYAYWVNKQIGTQVGSVIKGSESPDTTNLASSVQTLASNSDKSYGVCLALNNVFYTQPESTIYGVKKTGSAVTTISDQMTNPRGCVWDGDGTVFVADRGANAVYSFAGNMQDLGAAHITKAVDFEDSFGVAVFSSASQKTVALSLVFGIIAAMVSNAFAV